MATKRGELALVVGGALVLVGSMLAFAKGGGESINVHDAEEGAPYLIAGVAAILAGGLLWIMSGAVGRKVVAVLALLIVGFFGAYAAFVDMTDMGDFGLDPGIGLYMMLAGSIIAVIGAVLALTNKGDATTSAPPPAA